MNGTITVESEYGHGSTFNVRLRQAFVSETPVGKTVAEKTVAEIIAVRTVREEVATTARGEEAATVRPNPRRSSLP